jgi:hypothetical protein
MAFATETKPADSLPSAKQPDGGIAAQLLLLVLAATAGYQFSKKQVRKLKFKLLVQAVKLKLKKLFSFKKRAGKDPAFAILLICLAAVGVALLLGASTLTAVLIALLLGAIIGAMAYADEN